MKKILIGIIVFAGVINVNQAWAVSGNSVRITNEIKKSQPKVDRPLDEIKENVKEKMMTRAADLKLFKGKKIVITQGELTAINGTTLTVKKDDASYQVLTDDKTNFRRKFWGKSEISEFSVGDKLNIIGIFTDDAKTTIQAKIVRDISIQMRHGVFFGTIKSISGNTIVIESGKRGDQAITVSDTAKIVNRKQEKIFLTDMLVGHKIRVKGLWNSLKSTITEVEQIKDFTLPLQPKSSVQPTVKPSVVPSVSPVVSPTPVATPIVSPIPSPTV